MHFTPILSAFRRMQRSSNVPQTVGSLWKPYRGHEPTTLAEKSLRYVHSRFNVTSRFELISIFFIFLLSKVSSRTKLEY